MAKLLKIGQPVPGGCDVGCESCAFRAGSETRRELYNTMKATLCDLGGVPFYCHFDRNGVDFHTATVKPQPRELVICQGWKDAMRRRAQDPAWRTNRPLRKTLAEMAIGALECLIDGKHPENRDMYLKTIRTSIEWLVLRRPKKLRLRLPAEGER